MRDVHKVSTLTASPRLLSPYGIAMNRMRGAHIEVRCFALGANHGVRVGSAGIGPVVREQNRDGAPVGAVLQGRVKGFRSSFDGDLKSEIEKDVWLVLVGNSNNDWYSVKEILFIYNIYTFCIWVKQF